MREGTLQQAQSKTSILGWAIFITGIFYYCYAYLLRVYPSIMEPNLLHHFHINAGTFGNLAAFYYYAYAPMQLPVGVAVDKYGPRRSLIVACLVAVLGVFIFVSSQQIFAAEFGRFLIGFGSAFAYVTVLKLATIWLPRRYFATATGIATGSGMMAAVFTDIYLTRYLQHFGYRSTLYLCLFTGIVLAVLILLLVRDKPKSDSAVNMDEPEEEFAISYRQLGRYLVVLAKNPQMWIIGTIGALMYLPASVFMDVWGIPFLKASYHFSPEQAAFAVSLTTIGWIIFSPIAGALSDKLQTRKKPLIISTFTGAIIASFIFWVPNIPHALIYTLLFLLGAFCASHPLCFTLSKENNTHKISGTAIAFANCLIMFGGVIFQPMVGRLLVMDWNGKVMHGIPVYTSADYMHALSILPIGLLIAGLLTLVVRETFHRAIDKPA